MGCWLWYNGEGSEDGRRGEPYTDMSFNETAPTDMYTPHLPDAPPPHPQSTPSPRLPPPSTPAPSLHHQPTPSLASTPPPPPPGLLTRSKPTLIYSITPPLYYITSPFSNLKELPAPPGLRPCQTGETGQREGGGEKRGQRVIEKRVAYSCEWVLGRRRIRGGDREWRSG